MLFEAHRLFHGNFAERIHGHFHVGQINASVVRLDAHLDVEIDHAFDCYEDFHQLTPLCGDGLHNGHQFAVHLQVIVVIA
ncbi:hypothetical protein D3C84_966650 [compost metagenome]